MSLFLIVCASVATGLISFIGVFLFSNKNSPKLTSYLISLASGTLLGSAFLHLMPEALDQQGHSVLIKISSGVVLFFALEKFLIWRHCHLHRHGEDHTRPTRAHMVVLGDAIHNFIDGLIIASSFLASTSTGLSVTIAILLHEIPQEFGDFGVLIHGGYSLKRALVINGITATASLVGALLAYFFLAATPVIQTYLLPLSTGGFLYIALADLIPQLHEEVALRHSLGQLLLLSCGFGLTMFF